MFTSVPNSLQPIYSNYCQQVHNRPTCRWKRVLHRICCNYLDPMMTELKGTIHSNRNKIFFLPSLFLQQSVQCHNIFGKGSSVLYIREINPWCHHWTKLKYLKQMKYLVSKLLTTFKLNFIVNENNGENIFHSFTYLRTKFPCIISLW